MCAQTSGRAEASGEFPGLFLSESQWRDLPQCLEDPYFRLLDERNEECLDYWEDVAAGQITRRSADHANGKGGFEVHLWRWIKTRLLRNAVSWRLHGRDECLHRCMETVDCLLNRDVWRVYYDTTMLRHFDLKMSELTVDATFALDALGEHLGAERCEGLRAVLAEHALREYLAGLAAREWWVHSDFNWGTACHGNAGLAALALARTHPDLSGRVLREAREGLDFVIEALPAEGGWTEGMMYMTTMLGHLTDFVSALERVTGDDLGLPANPRLRASLDFRLYMMGGDDRPINFSNIREQTSEYCFPAGYWWADRCGRPEWAWFEDRHLKPVRDGGLYHDVEAFWHRRRFQPSREPQIDPVRHFRGLDWFKWTGRRTWLALRSGYNAGNHNNLDLGHFVFGAGGDRFLADPGYGAGQTRQHNAVTFRGREQAIGAEARIFRVRRRPGGFYLACDLTACYPNCLTYHHRHLLGIDETHLVVIDDAMGRQGRRVGMGLHLQTRLGHELTDAGARIDGQDAALHVRRLTPTGPIEVESWEWAELPITTLRWRPRPDLPHVRHAMLLSLDPPDCAFATDGDEAVITLDGRAWRVDLAEAVARWPQ